MPNNVYSSFLELLKTDSVISPLIADYKGLKSVHAMVQPEDSVLMPSLTLNMENDDILPSKTTEQICLLNVYAANPVQAKYISRVISGRLDDSKFTVLGVTMLFICNGLPVLGDSLTKEFNSPLEVRVVYYGD